MIERRTLGAIAALGCMVGGCGETEADDVGSFEATLGVWTEENRWTVADAPELRLGDWEEGGETFDGVRVATFLPSGRIAVVDQTVAAVRVFDRAGALTAELGREGQGPGEFRRVSDVWVHSDTIFVGDNRLGRVVFFDLRGAYLDQVTVPPDVARRTRVVATFSDGDYLLERSDARSRVVREAGPMRPDTVRWFRASRDFARLDLLATAVAMEVYGHPWSGGFALGEVMFGKRAAATVHGEELYLARADTSFRAEVIDPTGSVVETFGIERSARPVTDDDRARYTTWRLENAPVNADTAAWRRVFDDAPVREAFPATAAVRVDAEDNSWIQHFRGPWEAERWAVFDPELRWLGDVTLPPETALMDVGAQELLVVHTDDLGVETVTVYALEVGR